MWQKNPPDIRFDPGSRAAAFHATLFGGYGARAELNGGRARLGWWTQQEDTGYELSFSSSTTPVCTYIALLQRLLWTTRLSTKPFSTNVTLIVM
jgi:hypothetical protein